jgi:hypothetical protein
MNPLPSCQVHELPSTPNDQRWLIQDLWGYDAVGILGGEPKCCKSFCALTISLAVASGRLCLGNRAIGRPGPVLHFAAEDALHIVRDRAQQLARGLGIGDLSTIPLWVITSPIVRIDHSQDQAALDAAITQRRPVLVVLDPFIRLHRCDENHSGEVAPLLAYLRLLQRTHGCAIILVHHARKGGGGMRPGQALRGSSELHAWGDCNLFLRRHHRCRGHATILTLEAEHRAAASPPPIRLQLTTGGSAENVMQLVDITNARDAPSDSPDPRAAPPRSPVERILDLLRLAGKPLTRSDIQHQIRLRTARIGAALQQLITEQRLVHDSGAYSLSHTASS